MSGEKLPLAKLRHDLRTPINHILGYSELLEEDLTDRGVDNLEDLGKIRHAARTLLELIGTALSDDSDVAVASPKKTGEAFQASPIPVGQDHENDLVVEGGETGRILVVDDNLENRETLVRRLKRQGHHVAEAEDGVAALEVLAREQFDLVLLDVMMPRMDGYSALRKMKTDAQLRHVPVIMISALDEIDSLVRCIEAGAEDYLPKPFNPVLLRARIGATLEKKALRDQEREYLRTIEETQTRLEDELKEAARYVASILPPPVEKPIPITWGYEPSTELGGDSFGYHWIDDTRLAIYLLDVCGHGVGAALLSVAAINVIRSGALPGIDFLDPGQVLSGLNESFQMERHNNMYFTIWYGVFDTQTRTLRHSSGGHPPALLLQPGSGGDSIAEIRCPGMIIGVMPGMTYESDSLTVPEGSRLFVYSDGAYEIKRPSEDMMDFDSEFCAYLRENGRRRDIADALLKWIRQEHGSQTLDDDYSIVILDL